MSVYELASSFSTTVRISSQIASKEMNHDGVGVIVENEKGEFLLHLRDGNTTRMPHQWCLIGGAIDPGEDPAAAGVRETKEETSLSLYEPVFLKSFKFGERKIALVKGLVRGGQEHVVLGEGTELRFFSAGEALTFIRSLPYSNAFLDELKSYLEQTQKGVAQSL